jgi:hypothetical protein
MIFKPGDLVKYDLYLHHGFHDEPLSARLETGNHPWQGSIGVLLAPSKITNSKYDDENIFWKIYWIYSPTVRFIGSIDDNNNVNDLLKIS